MKKIILTTIIILMFVAALAGCVQQTIATPSPEKSAEQTPEKTAEPTATPEPSREPSPEISPEATKETAELVKIPKTENISYDEVTAMLGKPDKAVALLSSTLEIKDLIYSKYNRVFRVGNGTVDDVTYLYETFGGISLEMSEKQIKDILGEPSSKVAGDYTSGNELIYYDAGAYVTIDSKAIRFIFNSKFSGATSCGIGIGSTKEDVIDKYCVGMYPEDEINDDNIQIGNASCGIRFYFENGKVTEIFVGESSE